MIMGFSPLPLPMAGTGTAGLSIASDGAAGGTWGGGWEGGKGRSFFMVSRMMGYVRGGWGCLSSGCIGAARPEAAVGLDEGLLLMLTTTASFQ